MSRTNIIKKEEKGIYSVSQANTHVLYGNIFTSLFVSAFVKYIVPVFSLVVFGKGRTECRFMCNNLLK